MIILIIACLLFSGVSLKRADQNRCRGDEFHCESGQCIDKKQWCDGIEDCRDRSDERYCNRVTCSEKYFRCGQGRCIPLSGRCDGMKDCLDASDEKNCSAPVKITQASRNAVSNAVNYLLKERLSDYGWSSTIATSRANVALAFAERVYPIDETEKKLMSKQLDIQLSLDLISSSGIALSHLALYINALYATCQNPTNFQGRMDVVNLLRSQTSNINTNFNLPLVFLTLCIANKENANDKRQLVNIYNRNNRISSKALTVLAMECVRRKNNADFTPYLSDFTNQAANFQNSNLDVYSKALVMQALNALGHPNRNLDLLSHQLYDGSFGDLLATYYAIPALLNSSLLDLKCEHMNKDESIVPLTENDVGGKQIIYSLWTASSGNNGNGLSISLTFKGRKTFYDIMKMAASRDPMYKFMVDETAKGKEVYSIAGIPNDTEMGMSWKLYKANSEIITINSNQNLRELTTGVDKIFPAENSHYVFWLKRT